MRFRMDFIPLFLNSVLIFSLSLLPAYVSYREREPSYTAPPGEATVVSSTIAPLPTGLGLTPAGSFSDLSTMDNTTSRPMQGLRGSQL